MSMLGYAVAIDGDRAIVGAHAHPGNGDFAGAAYIFAHAGSEWVLEATLQPEDAAANDHFGGAVSLDGDYAVVGASWDGMEAGSAYVFRREGTAWVEEAKLLASDGQPLDRFASAVSLHEDLVLVGAAGNDEQGENAGAAYVFGRDGTTWTERAKLLATDGARLSAFGSAVSLDDGTALITASSDDNENGIAAGAAYVFSLDDGIWTEHQKLLPADGMDYGNWGISVSLDGDTAIVGAAMFEGGIGSAYIFELDGGTWTERAKLQASDGGIMHNFGFGVGISGDVAVVGAECLGSCEGRAYVFERSGDGWAEREQLRASDGQQGASFGFAVDVDGPRTVIGAPGHNQDGRQDPTEEGGVYIIGL